MYGFNQPAYDPDQKITRQRNKRTKTPPLDANTSQGYNIQDNSQRMNTDMISSPFGKDSHFDHFNQGPDAKIQKDIEYRQQIEYLRDNNERSNSRSMGTCDNFKGGKSAPLRTP